MEAAINELDRWLRHEFVDLNTELEEAYFAARSEILDGPDLEKTKRAILEDGGTLIARIVGTGRIPADARERYRLLGAVGFYLAACRRHEVESGGEPLATAWSLANRLGSSLGVAPRFVFAHQSIHNPAVRGTFLTFTSLRDEEVFIRGNALPVLAYQRAADALRRIPPMGVSSPMATYLFDQARAALDDVLRFNRTLGDELDPDRFFLNIRPYFKTYRVGAVEYRGANAGDFAAINEIDLLLGLCDAADPFYQHVLAEKYPYVPPEDQGRLRAAALAEPLLAAFLREAAAGSAGERLRPNGELFLEVCRAHAAAYTYHHHRLVKPFLERPAEDALPDRREDITASGPPLDVVIGGLARLSDLRAARDRPGLTTARASLDRLRALLATGP
ncbi:monodechloroaminopyrrolnitrin synthase PrnB family protein [Actinoallomurus sp. NPDC050550]|uniref:monodechloroaminopyrrolnitrin synthase PrnB family protein n=1 Tax=Actinoallomurus sp. NPDC050550 TaxID=3154937 RepID=UPI0033FEF65C